MQERAVETRSVVLQAAAVIFERRGYAAATIAEILQEAGVTKGAAYFHFGSKEALARAVVAEQFVWRRCQTLDDEDPLQHLVDLSYLFAQALQSDVQVQASIRLTLERNTFERQPGEANPYELWLNDAHTHFDAAAARGELAVPVEAAANLLVACVTGGQLISEAVSAREDLTDRTHAMWQLLAPTLASADRAAALDLRPLRDR
ncbi:ScbR family autoregulator-binding transcription factor [Tsukamurella ocularis]|uniref:ScbR family autoregulator-binding transcription factor n=1 Tax=Tsukamurella ocularis TaxID=1970234 RepID=UPI00216A0BF0|nr:ScbR family autoregulator-binding transcription factor [Tsukamurella ocularis]MCS3782460.1 AcrR family transcriptional regulator [Tsukamurella ocularis]MCS3789988.1 AcrR family transcriptional regulator [Tsukamurella ocularis]MCS3853250.1 AcrR family transcriptional regulator [Tsukamurella ocularis]